MNKAQISIFIILFPIQIMCSPWCMDNSLYGNIKNGYDYKKYHMVACACPCERYEQSYKRGICQRCLHPKKPVDLCSSSKISCWQEEHTKNIVRHALHKK